MSYHTVGTKYEETKQLDIKEVAKLIRADIKKEFPGIKASVKIERFSMGQAINVVVKESAEPLKNPLYDGVFDWKIRTGQITSWPSEDNVKRDSITEEGQHVAKGVKDIVESYNFDDSDMMTDYSHVRFYSHVRIEA